MKIAAPLKQRAQSLFRQLVRFYRCARSELFPAHSKEDALFAAFVKTHLDGQAYLEAHPDVRSAGFDPVDHWLEFGMNEGRAFFPDATFYQGDYARRVAGEGWQHFSWRGNPVAIWIGRGPEEALFAEFVNAHFDRHAYLEAYPDVDAAGMDPVRHWLEFGMAEGRFLYPGAVVIAGEAAERVDETHWRHFTWRGKRVAVRNVRPIKPSLVAQIRAQARHDPSVVAVGPLVLGALRQFDGPDLLDRGGFDVRSIFAAIAERPDTVLVVPHLQTGEGEQYAADLVASLSALSKDKILVLVTEDSAQTAGDWQAQAMLAPLRAARVVFWRDVCGPNNRHPVVFGRLMNALRPSRLVVIDSRLGLDMVAGFGRGLSKHAKLYCAYFSLGMEGLAAPAGARFPARTLPFALALTDNVSMLASLRRQWGELPGPGIALLPPRLEVAADQTFSKRQAAHRKRAENPSRSLRWVWISRLEPAKGMGILAELAGMRPSDQFDLFGPADGDLQEMGLAQPNIEYRGPLADLASANFEDYDGFVFTSLFESMPRTVLEMSQHAIPMVLADVGGLRDTFDDAAAQFVPHGEDHHMTARAFAAALETFSRLTPEETLAMTRAARAQAVSRHAADAHVGSVASIFGYTADHV